MRWTGAVNGNWDTVGNWLNDDGTPAATIPLANAHIQFLSGDYVNPITTGPVVAIVLGNVDSTDAQAMPIVFAHMTVNDVNGDTSYLNTIAGGTIKGTLSNIGAMSGGTLTASGGSASSNQTSIGTGNFADISGVSGATGATITISPTDGNTMTIGANSTCTFDYLATTITYVPLSTGVPLVSIVSCTVTSGLAAVGTAISQGTYANCTFDNSGFGDSACTIQNATFSGPFQCNDSRSYILGNQFNGPGTIEISVDQSQNNVFNSDVTTMVAFTSENADTFTVAQSGLPMEDTSYNSVIFQSDANITGPGTWNDILVDGTLTMGLIYVTSGGLSVDGDAYLTDVQWSFGNVYFGSDVSASNCPMWGVYIGGDCYATDDSYLGYASYTSTVGGTLTLDGGAYLNDGGSFNVINVYSGAGTSWNIAQDGNGFSASQINVANNLVVNINTAVALISSSTFTLVSPTASVIIQDQNTGEGPTIQNGSSVTIVVPQPAPVF